MGLQAKKGVEQAKSNAESKAKYCKIII